jgi:hypothetical protein
LVCVYWAEKWGRETLRSSQSTNSRGEKFSLTTSCFDEAEIWNTESLSSNYFRVQARSHQSLSTFQTVRKITRGEFFGANFAKKNSRKPSKKFWVAVVFTPKNIGFSEEKSQIGNFAVTNDSRH